MARRKKKEESAPSEDVVVEVPADLDPTGHPFHESGRRLSEYEWAENQEADDGEE